MNDKEFILYLCEEIWDLLSDGSEPDLDTIENELKNRDINPEDVFIY